MKSLQNMKTFEMYIMLACFIHSNFAQGLHKIFPSITDTLDVRTETSLSLRDDFKKNDLYMNSEINENGDNAFLISNDKRLSLLKKSLSNIGEILKDYSSVDPVRNYFEKSSSQFDHLRGVKVPSSSESSYWPGGKDVPTFSGLFPVLSNPRYITVMRKHRRSSIENVQQKRSFQAEKRKSAITPPSRDWCRLIGYRVCPRATRF